MRSLQLAVLALAMFSLLASSAGLSGEVLRGAAPSSHQIVVSPSTPQPLPITAPTPTSNSSGNTGTGVPPAPLQSRRPRSGTTPGLGRLEPPNPPSGGGVRIRPQTRSRHPVWWAERVSIPRGHLEFIDNQWIQTHSDPLPSRANRGLPYLRAWRRRGLPASIRGLEWWNWVLGGHLGVQRDHVDLGQPDGPVRKSVHVNDLRQLHGRQIGRPIRRNQWGRDSL